MRGTEDGGEAVNTYILSSPRAVDACSALLHNFVVCIAAGDHFFLALYVRKSGVWYSCYIVDL